jgi:hypothetical protein
MLDISSAWGGALSIVLSLGYPVVGRAVVVVEEIHA